MTTINQLMAAQQPNMMQPQQMVTTQPVGQPVAFNPAQTQMPGAPNPTPPLSGAAQGGIGASGRFQMGQGQTPAGLAGATQALRQGTQGALTNLTQSTDQAIGQLQQGRQSALRGINQPLMAAGITGAQNLNQGANQALGSLRNITQGGINQATGAIQGGAQEAVSNLASILAGGVQDATGALQGGSQAALGAAQGAFDRGINPLEQFGSSGLAAQNQQAALSGALGPEAQAAAMQAFTESPGQAFLREEGERAVLRNAAAVGGLGGGNVLRELQRQGVGLAAQDFQNQFARLGDVAGRGLDASRAAGQLSGQLGNLQAGIQQQTGQNIADLLSGAASQQAGTTADIQSQAGRDIGSIVSNLEGQRAQAAGDIQQQRGQDLAQLGATLAGRQAGLLADVEQGTAASIANLLSGRGTSAANLLSQTGRDIAGMRQQTGRDLSAAIGGAAGDLADLRSEQGAGLADITGTAATNLANLFNAAGSGDAEAQQQLSQLLSSLSQNEAQALAQLFTGSADARAQGTIGAAQGFRGGLDSLAGFLGAGGRLFDAGRNLLPQQQPDPFGLEGLREIGAI